MHKSLNDVEAVIALGKPASVVNLFIMSYLTGEALVPVVAAEEEHAKLRAQEDQPDVLDPETGALIYSPDAERDARIAELETQYPHLVDPVDGSTVEDRRPDPVLDLEAARELKRGEIKRAFEQELVTGKIALSLGWEIDCRRGGNQDDIGNMERLRDLHLTLGSAGTTQIEIRGADNLPHTVTLDELQSVVIPEMIQYGLLVYQGKWDREGAVAAAASIEEVFSA